MTDDSRPRSGTIAHFLDLAKSVVPPMHPGGRPFVAGSFLASLVLRRFSRKLGVLGFVVTAWVAWFFREPKRVAPARTDVVTAAADGTVYLVDEAVPPAELNWGTEAVPRVSVFLSIFDVHVQRAPVAGEVVEVAYRPGAFLSADLDKASEDNERNSLLIRTDSGAEVVVVQIAGLVARRILCQVNAGQRVEVGQTYGLIRFGSRVDVYLPRGSKIRIAQGQRTIGGETVLAELPSAV